MSEVVKEAVVKYGECRNIVNWFILREGYEFYYNAFYDYWIYKKENNRI